MNHRLSLITISFVLLAACGGTKKPANNTQATATPTGPTANADSLLAFCAKQCAFGPRVMNTAAHDSCAKWIASKFKTYGLSVTLQQATLKGYDGKQLKATNIVASLRPEANDRILLCAHYDTRPWADNDPDTANWRKPVMGASDGASGVAALIEAARLLAADSSLTLGVDFICFDAEDNGTPQWSDQEDNGDYWALGAKHWAANPHRQGYTARFGILLDMVGSRGARFYQEGVSLHFAKTIVDKVWAAAAAIGHTSLFPTTEGPTVTDDHLPINQTANIPTIDIIAHYPDCPQSSFGPTWHTTSDNMANIDKDILQAATQTVLQTIYSEK